MTQRDDLEATTPPCACGSTASRRAVRSADGHLAAQCPACGRHEYVHEAPHLEVLTSPRSARIVQGMAAHPDTLVVPDPPETVRAHHLAIVTKLTEAGYQWRGPDSSDTAMIEQFIRTHGQPPAGWKMSPEQSAVIAQDQAGEPVCICVLGGLSFSGRNSVLVQHVVTHPQHTGLGIETASLNLVHQVLPEQMKPLACSAGTCSPAEATMYAAAGYTVLKPHAPFVFPGSDAAFVTPNPVHSCWAYKMG